MARDAFCITLRPAIIDLDIAALDPAEFTEGLLKRLYACLPFGVVGNRHKYPEPSHPFGLRVHCERPCRRAAELRDELAAFHSITSSARASSIGGTSRPIALAVFRLITSSNLVGAWIGRSPGFSPFRIRSTYRAACAYMSRTSIP